MSDSQLYPLNFYLINIVEDTVVSLDQVMLDSEH